MQTLPLNWFIFYLPFLFIFCMGSSNVRIVTLCEQFSKMSCFVYIWSCLWICSIYMLFRLTYFLHFCDYCHGFHPHFIHKKVSHNRLKFGIVLFESMLLARASIHKYALQIIQRNVYIVLHEEDNCIPIFFIRPIYLYV